jgi:hypothetical protein
MAHDRLDTLTCPPEIDRGVQPSAVQRGVARGSRAAPAEAPGSRSGFGTPHRDQGIGVRRIGEKALQETDIGRQWSHRVDEGPGRRLTGSNRRVLLDCSRPGHLPRRFPVQTAGCLEGTISNGDARR